MRRSKRLAALCVAGAGWALTAASAAGASEVGFRTIAYGTATDATLGPPEPVARIVRDAPAAAALLHALEMDRALPRLGSVDFARRSLVAVLGDWRPNPSYGVLVGAIDVAGGTATVTATVVHRAVGHADVLARPWSVLSVPRAAVAGVAPEVPVVLRCVRQSHCRW
jgi:hypothetical protein